MTPAVGPPVGTPVGPPVGTGGKEVIIGGNVVCRLTEKKKKELKYAIYNHKLFYARAVNKYMACIYLDFKY